jgi:membrane-bound lytic murein transglycosylase A
MGKRAALKSRQPARFLRPFPITSTPENSGFSGKEAPMHRRSLACLSFVVLGMVLPGCATLCKAPVFTPENSYRQVLPDTAAWADEGSDPASFLQALDNSLGIYNHRDENEVITLGPARYTVRELKASLQSVRDFAAARGLGPEFFAFLQNEFDAFVPTATPIITSYCTTQLHGAWKWSPRYPYPIYHVPADLVTVDTKSFKRLDPLLADAGSLIGRVTPDHRVVPYFTREEIDFGSALKGQNAEWLWVDDPGDLYILHVEGSGIVELEDGSTTRVAYAGKNGQPSHLIGRYLREEKKLTDAQLSVPGIKQYLKEHPLECRRALASDPSYVFFDPPAGDFATGCFGTSLTAYRSLATDRRLFPPGVLVYMEAVVPVLDKRLNPVGEKKIRTLVFSQDTGGAIRGPGRADWYTGEGPRAEAIAGNTRHEGKLVVLIKKKAAAK